MSTSGVTPHSYAQLDSMRQILDQVSDMVWSVSFDGRSLLYINPAAQRLFGIQPDDVMGIDDWMQLVHPEDRAQFQRDLMTIRETGSLRHKYRILRHEDSVWLDQQSTVVNSPTGEPLRIDSVGQIITAHEISSPDELESNQEHQTLREHVSLCVLRKDKKGRIQYANENFCELMGCSVEELIGKTDFDLFPADLARMYSENDRSVMESGHPEHVVEKNQAADGRTTYVEVLKLPAYSAKGNVVGIQVIFWDVSSHKKTEADLEQSKFLMDTLLDNVPDAIYFKDRKSRFIRISRSHARLFDLDEPTEAVGKTDADFFDTTHAHNALDDERQIIETGKPILAKLERETWPDRDDTWCSTTKVPLRNASGEILGTFGISRDVTQQMRAELELGRERDLLKTIINNIPDLIYVKDRHGRFVTGNHAILRMLGLESLEQLCGKTDYDFSPPEFACNYVTDDQIVMRTENPMIDHEECCQFSDGSCVWMLTTKVPLYNESNAVSGIVGIGRDITARKRASEELLAAKQAADAANSAKSDFLANMSHEIRTPMNAIIGMTELLLDTRLNASQRNYLKMVRDSGESLLSIINDVLDFSKIEAGMLDIDSVAFEIRETIGDTMKGLAVRAHDKGLEIAFRIAPDIPKYVVGDAGRLRQVLVNLVGNAIKFTDHGEVVVDVEQRQASETQTEICFCVRDTGRGIPEDKSKSIFKEFEQVDSSTTRRYGGTGLGLAISSRLVDLMSGRIWVESQLGRGSQFFFTTRLGVAPNGTGQDQNRGAVVVGGTRVLVVDDNDTNRTILNEILSNWGMIPTLAGGMDEAMEAVKSAEADEQPYGLIISDVNMPDQDGFAFATWYRSEANQNNAPIIMLTSGGRAGDGRKRAKLKISERLMKPVKQSELFDAIVRALGVSASEDHQRHEDVSDYGIRNLKILLAEDNLVNQKLAIGVLNKHGHEVIIANNGQEAIEAIQREKFDLVLMDVQMPVVDGLSATRAIRQLDGPVRSIPIIAMTAHAMKGDREECLNAGMDDYVPKPIRMISLFKKLAKVVQARKNQKPDAVEAVPAKKNIGVSGNGKSNGKSVPPPVDSENPATTDSDTPSDPEEFPIVDWDRLNKTVGGNEELLFELVEAFTDESASLSKALRDAVESNDLSVIKIKAHTLKGAALALGATRLVHMSGAIEQQAKRSDLQDAIAQLDCLDTTLAKTLEVIHEYCQSK